MKNRMNRVIRWAFAAIICVALVFFADVQGARAWYTDEKVAKLSIHSYAETATGGMAHAYLTIENISDQTLDFLSYPIYPGESMAISKHGNKNAIRGLGGVYINLEYTWTINQPVASYEMEISRSQFNSIIIKTPSESYYDHSLLTEDMLWHNCTTYSVMIWNSVADEAHQIDEGLFNIDNPYWVRDQIKEWKNSRYGAAIKPSNRKYSKCDCYYVTQQSELIPCDAPAPNVKAQVVNDGRFLVTWDNAAEIDLIGTKNINGYYIAQTNITTGETKEFCVEGLERFYLFDWWPTDQEIHVYVGGASLTSEGNRLCGATNGVSGIIPSESRLYFYDEYSGRNIDLESCCGALYTRNLEVDNRNLDYAYWCQTRIHGVNGATGGFFGRLNNQVLPSGWNVPIEDVLLFVEQGYGGVHVRSGAFSSNRACSYIVLSADESSICVTYLDGENTIRCDNFTWLEFRERLIQEGHISYIEFWNFTGAHDPEGDVSVSAGIGHAGVKGWAVDASDPSRSVTIWAKLGSGEAEFVTDIAMPELGYDGYHGFEVKLNTDEVGMLPITIVARNIGEGSDTVLYDGVVEVVARDKAPDQSSPILTTIATVYGDSLDVQFEVASHKQVQTGYFLFGGVFSEAFAVVENDEVLWDYPEYTFGYRSRVNFNVCDLERDRTYSYTGRFVFTDGTSSDVEGWFYVPAEAVTKAPVLHIDSPQVRAYSGLDNIEASGWIACDEPIQSCFYEVTSKDGTVGFQGELSGYNESAVSDANPGYAYGIRLRGVIPNGSLKAYKDYICTFSVTLADGTSHLIRQDFSMGDIPDKGTLNRVHVDAPVSGRVYSGTEDIEINSWVVANSPVTYCMYEVIRASDGACVGQWTLDTPDQHAVDLEAEYPDYLNHKRYRGVIEIADLNSFTDYIFKIWYGIGDKGFQTNAYAVRFSTGEVKPREYIISYEPEGGFGAPEPQIKYQRQPMTISKTVPTQFGRVFAGWSTQRGSRSVHYKPGDVYTDDKSRTLFAVWWDEQLINLPKNEEHDSFKIPVYFGGMEGWYAFIPKESGSYRLSTEAAAGDTTIAVYSEDGALIRSVSAAEELIVNLSAGSKYYIRCGYVSSKIVGSYMLSISRGKQVNYVDSGREFITILGWDYKYFGKDLFLRDAPDRIIRISLGLRGGEAETDTVELADTFCNWNTEPDGTGIAYMAGEVYKLEQALTLYPEWRGALLGELPVPTKEGFEFMGWYHVTREGEVLATAQDVIKQDETLVAQWKAKELHIDFDMNGGVGEFETLIVTYGDSFTVPEEEPTRYGYRFDGWSVSPRIYWPSYFPGKSYTPVSAMTLYAAWTPPTEINADAKKATFSFSLDGERTENFFAFTPDTTSQYKFRVAGEAKSKQLAVCLADWTEIESLETVVDGSRLYRTYELEAGTTYTIRVTCEGSKYDAVSLIMYRGYRVDYVLGDKDVRTEYCFEEQTDFKLLGLVEKTMSINFFPRGGTIEEITRHYQVTVNEWNTRKDGSGAAYSPSSTQKFSMPMTLYPTAYAGPQVGELETPKRGNYEFDGWFTEMTGGEQVTKETRVSSFDTLNVRLYAHWTKLDMRHVKRIDSPSDGAIYPMDNNIEFAGWIVAHKEITAVEYEVADPAGNVVYVGGTIFDEAAPDLDGAYPDYPYRKRMRGVISIAELAPYTEYTVSMWGLLGETGTKTAAITTTFSTGPMAEIPDDVSDRSYELFMTQGEAEMTYVFTPEVSTRYRFTLSGDLDERQIEVISNNATLNVKEDIAGDYVLSRTYLLEAGKPYEIAVRCSSEVGNTGMLRVQRGYCINYESLLGSSVHWNYAGDGEVKLKGPVSGFLTIEFMNNGGKLPVEPCSYLHRVLQWNTADDGSGTAYAPASVQSFAQDMTLYGILNDVPVGELEIPEFEGFIFDGWYDQMVGGQKVTGDMLVKDFLAMGRTTLYARWIKDKAYKEKVTLRFYPETDEGGVFTMEVGVNSPVTLPDPPIYEGYQFLGWFTDPHTGPQVFDGACFSENYSLCARWKEIKWSNPPTLYYPKIDGRTLTFTWEVDEPADEYMLYEADRQGFVTIRAIVTDTKATIENVEYGLYSYNVVPVKEGEHGSLSNSIGIELMEPRTLSIPAAVTKIEESAFEGLPMLTHVKIGSEVVSIGSYAFRGCTGLWNVTVPDSVRSFGVGIFDGCSSELVVHCGKGSAAQAYCQTYGISYTVDD